MSSRCRCFPRLSRHSRVRSFGLTARSKIEPRGSVIPAATGGTRSSPSSARICLNCSDSMASKLRSTSGQSARMTSRKSTSAENPRVETTDRDASGPRWPGGLQHWIDSGGVFLADSIDVDRVPDPDRLDGAELAEVAKCTRLPGVPHGGASLGNIARWCRVVQPPGQTIKQADADRVIAGLEPSRRALDCGMGQPRHQPRCPWLDRRHEPFERFSAHREDRRVDLAEVREPDQLAGYRLTPPLLKPNQVLTPVEI